MQRLHGVLRASKCLSQLPPIVPVVDHLAGHAAVVADSKADCVLLVFMLQKYALSNTTTARLKEMLIFAD